MKSFLILGTLLIALGAAALERDHPGRSPALQKEQAREVVLKDPAHLASLIYERTTDNGSIVVSETWSIGMTSRIVKSTYTEAGLLTARMVAITKGRTTSKADATINPRGAFVTSMTRAGTSPGSNIPLMNHMSVVDPTVRWFASDQPAKGASATFMSFDPEFRYWEQVTATFDGQGKLGQSPEGNIVTRKAARSTVTVLLDDKGMPLVWEENQLHLVRQSR
jgi:hypothetical protein